MPWPVAAVAGALASAAIGWLMCLALCMVGWLSDTSLPLGGPVRLASGLFLLAHGVPITLAGVRVSIVPLTLALLVISCGVGVTRLALRRGFGAAPGTTTRRVLSVAGVVAGAYVVVVAVVTVLTQSAAVAGQAILGGIVVGGLIGWLAVAPLFGWRAIWAPGVPDWVKALPRAVGAGVGVMMAGAALLLAIALAASHERIVQLQAGLGGGTLGTVVLTIVQTLWLPNLVIWGTSWLVGAGVSLGAGTVVSPVAVQMGMLPALPVFGAVPTAGVPARAELLWLVVPLAAGTAAAWVTLRAQATHELLEAEAPRADIGGLIGGATGIVSGLVVTLVAVISRGDLGAVRLTGLGPRLGAMVLLATTLMGVSGLVFGVVVGLRRSMLSGGRAASAAVPGPPRPPTPPSPPTPPPTPTPTPPEEAG